MSNRVDRFREWLDHAAAGQVYVYHTGRLDTDRGTCLGDVWISAGDIDQLGDMAYEAFVGGKVHLFQRKLHDNEYEYIAMKRSRYGRQW